MNVRNFHALIKARWAEGKFLCVGIDPDDGVIPEEFEDDSIFSTLFNFCRDRIEKTFDIVCAYKLNYQFFKAHGSEGIRALEAIMRFVQGRAPAVPVILDDKNGDIGNSNTFCARGDFDLLLADALVVHPYLGGESLATAFLDRKEKGIFVLCRTSNPGAGEFQDLVVEVPVDGEREILGGVPDDYGHFSMPSKMPLYQYVAHRVKYVWNVGRGNCGLVTGATYPHEIGEVRHIVRDLPLLIPGIGKQGGDLAAAIAAAGTTNNDGFIISSSSGIIFAKDPRAAALELDQQIRALMPA